METKILVHIDIEGTTHFVGNLWSRLRRERESSTFEYAPEWLANPKCFSLEPSLSIGPGPLHAPMGKPLFGSIGDSAPDRWGRLLMRRAERRRAKQENAVPRTLRELDYLLGVDDEARQGALRFSKTKYNNFLAPPSHSRIPPLLALPRLLLACENVLDDSENDEDLGLLLAPGSSLGGARPKASVLDRGGVLALAKFPQKEDDVDTVRWEAVALELAHKSGIQVPKWRLETIGKKVVLILHRFDRELNQRIPFLSAMSMLSAQDNETRSYLEIVDAIRQYGAFPKQDMHKLWRRLVFNILISNTDDHLRNHAFLYWNTQGWKLSPAYDLNPTPTDIKPRILSTSIDFQDNTASLDLALEVLEYFDLKYTEAKLIISQVGRAVSTWKNTAKKQGLKSNEIERMASAFQHEDLAKSMKAVS